MFDRLGWIWLASACILVVSFLLAVGIMWLFDLYDEVRSRLINRRYLRKDRAAVH